MLRDARGAVRRAVGMVRYFEGSRGRPDCVDDLPYRLTASGAWARSRPAHLFFFFRRIKLSGFRLFADLGSGDGAAACVAGLFTHAVGIESDPELASSAGRAARNLDIVDRVQFMCADFFTQRIRAADCLFIYPDKPIYSLEDVLDGWVGTLLVYGPHFPPKRMQLSEKLTCGKETLSVYRAARARAAP